MVQHHLRVILTDEQHITPALPERELTSHRLAIVIHLLS
jgi:hypothetical protein